MNVLWHGHTGNNRLAAIVVGTLSLAAWLFHARRRGQQVRNYDGDEERWEDFLGI